MPKVQINNATTREIIVREMTAEELAQWELDKAKAEKDKLELAAKEAARQALLDRLGITAEEAQLLLGSN